MRAASIRRLLGSGASHQRHLWVFFMLGSLEATGSETISLQDGNLQLEPTAGIRAANTDTLRTNVNIFVRFSKCVPSQRSALT